ncbi:MAG: O-antigen ligase family protein [Kiritimatiellia bacterium]
MQPPEDHQGSRRRRRSQVAPVSLRRGFYDGITLIFLLAPAWAGLFLYGGVRTWSIALLMMFSLAGLLLFFLRPLFAPDLREIRIPPGFFAGLALLAYVAFRIPGSEISHITRFHFVMLANAVLILLAWTNMGHRGNRWKWITGLLVVVVSLILWYALVLHVRGSRMVLNLVRPETYGMRASGTYMCPNHFANLLEIVMCICLAFLFSPGAGGMLRIFSGYTLALIAPVLVLTQSRSGWIGGAVGFVATLWLVLWKRNRKLFYVSFIGLPLLVAGLGFVLWTTVPVVRNRIEYARTGDVRTQLWSDAMGIVKDNPIFGCGPGTYRWVEPKYRSHTYQSWVMYAHNEYVQILAEYGAVGLVLFAVFVFWGLGRLLFIYLKRDLHGHAEFLTAGFLGASAASLAHAVFDFNFHISANSHILILLGGLVSAELYAAGAFQPRRISARAFSLCGALCAVILLLLSAQALASDVLFRLGEKARGELKDEKALQYFQKAVKIDPGFWEPWKGMGHIHKTRGFWSLDAEAKKENSRLALESYDEALKRNPYALEVVYGKSKVHSALGENDRAIELLRQIVNDYPKDSFYITQLGLALRLNGRHEEALEVFERAARLPEPPTMVMLNIQLLKEALGR